MFLTSYSRKFHITLVPPAELKNSLGDYAQHLNMIDANYMEQFSTYVLEKGKTLFVPAGYLPLIVTLADLEKFKGKDRPKIPEKSAVKHVDQYGLFTAIVVFDFNIKHHSEASAILQKVTAGSQFFPRSLKSHAAYLEWKHHMDPNPDGPPVVVQ